MRRAAPTRPDPHVAEPASPNLSLREMLTGEKDARKRRIAPKTRTAVERTQSSTIIKPLATPSMAALQKVYLAAQPRLVRIFNSQFEKVWSNRPADVPIAVFSESGEEGIPGEGFERDRWPVARVIAGLPRAMRLYTTRALPDQEGHANEETWRVTAYPIESPDGTLVVEETERVDSPVDDAARLIRLDQDVEDLLHNVVAFMQHGEVAHPLRLPNPHIQNCQEIRGCANPDCPAHGNSSAERCWEVPHSLGNGAGAPDNLLDKFHSCSKCNVFGLASPDSLIRISENFNRLISLLQLKYQESFDVQHRMQQADKLAIMGELLACIAHEIKNPLGIIIGRLDIIGLEMESMTPEQLSEDLATIYQQANRVRQIIDHLLRMARPEPPAFQPVSINSVIQDSVAMVRKMLKDRKVEVVTSLQPDLSLIQADQIQLQQVLLNLILNARDAMEEGGTLRISSLAGNGAEPGVTVTVADSGQGIAPDQLTRLFSSFHTTKLNQGGTGLGLAVCRRIMRVHNGRISAESQLGKGTTMQLWFPLGRSAA